MQFIAQGKTNWKFLAPIIVLATVVGGGIIFYQNWYYPEKKLKDNDLILFQKDESWGPCPPEFSACQQVTKLYYSGKLILEGEENGEKQLETETVEKVINKINSTDIINRDCSAELPLPDYLAIYNINLDGKNKRIIFPNCQEEIKKIEELIIY